MENRLIVLYHLKVVDMRSDGEGYSASQVLDVLVEARRREF